MVNGRKAVAADASAPPEMPLPWVLRDVLDLTGTKYACGVAACGARVISTLHEPVASIRSTTLGETRSGHPRAGALPIAIRGAGTDSILGCASEKHPTWSFDNEGSVQMYLPSMSHDSRRLRFRFTATILGRVLMLAHAVLQSRPAP
jgi:hypothetical protein